jgi:hypothetical protein
MLAQIPDGAWSEYGFADGAAVAKATLSAPMPIYTITPAALDGYKQGDPIGSLLSDTTLWYVPVRVEGPVRAVLVVDLLDGKWQAVSLGYVPLAGPLEVLLDQWPQSKGFHPKLVMVYQAQQYLFTIPELGEDNLTPLSGGQGAGSGFKAGPSKLRFVGETVSALKPVVADNLSGR